MSAPLTRILIALVAAFGVTTTVGRADDPTPADDVRLGVALTPVSKQTAAELGVGKNAGGVVSAVQPNSAAATAGMKKGDVLVELGGKAVSADPAGFRKLLLGLPKGDPVEAVVFRDGVRQVLSVGPLGKPNAVGRLEAADKPNGRLEAVPTSEGAGSFNVMAAQANQDGFQIFASGEGVAYEIVGRFRNGKKIPTSIRITDDGQLIAQVKSLDKVPDGHVTAVTRLLGSVSNR